MTRVIIGLCLLALFPYPAMAACLNLTLAGVPGIATFQGSSGQYLVYDPTQYLQTVNFRVQGEATGATCEYFVTLSAGQSGDFRQRKLTRDVHVLNYNVYTDVEKSNILKAPPTAGGNEIIVGKFPLPSGVNLNQTNDHSFFWTIDPLQIVPASTASYQDTTLTLNLYSGLVLGINTLQDTKTITFRTRAESSVDLSLVDSGAPFDLGDTIQVIDFGTLETGAQRGFDIVIRSNDAYRVTMRSENLQRVVHSRAPAIGDAINYTVIFNGGEVDLTSGTAVELTSGTGT